MLLLLMVNNSTNKCKVMYNKNNQIPRWKVCMQFFEIQEKYQNISSKWENLLNIILPTALIWIACSFVELPVL